MFIMTFQNEHTWDVSPDIGFLTFASPEDAKKAEDLFNKIQQEAKAVVKDAERYRWLRASFVSHQVLAVTRYDWIPSGVKRYLDIALDEGCDKGMRGEDVG